MINFSEIIMSLSFLSLTNLFYSFSPSVFYDDQWSVGSVLDSFNIPLLYEQILKERRRELIGLNEYMTDKMKELQVINESLRHDSQSLQEALRETHSLSGKTKLHELVHYLSNNLGALPPATKSLLLLFSPMCDL